MHGNGAQMCHRVAHSYDCGMMEHHHHADPDSGSSAVSAVQQDQKCPMSCCMQASSTAASPVTASANAAPLLVSQAFKLFESQVFVAAGFSTHTDRGPPHVSPIS
jgi:hypothetical protein